MDSQFEIKLIECLGRLDEGEPLDSILAAYPDYASALRPLLETATALEDLRIAPRETARIASRRAFLNQAYELRESKSQQRPWLSRRIAIAVASLVAVFIFMSGAVAASASALPNEPLYGLKRAVEDARLLVAAGADKEQLVMSFGQRRRDEINLLLAMRRDTAIAFEGTIELIRPNGWEVSGLYIYFDRATSIMGNPVLGSYVHIQGHTQAGQLFADSISIQPGSSSTINLIATATATPSATATLSATATPNATATVMPSATAKPSPSPAPQPELVPSPLASPTSAPTRVPTRAPGPRATRVPPTSAPPTAVPPTLESDHSGSGGTDDNSGSGNNNDNSGNDNSGSGSNNSGGDDNSGNDNSGSGDNSGSTNSGGDDNSGSGGHGGGGGGGGKP